MVNEIEQAFLLEALYRPNTAAVQGRRQDRHTITLYGYVKVSATTCGCSHILTRQAMYVQRNIKTCSCNHCCRGKATSITYCECVFVALGIQH